MPIYYVREVLNGAEGRYTPLEKMVLASVITARRMANPFQEESPQVEEMEISVRFDFRTSNNEVEYVALAMDIRMAYEPGAQHLIAYSDSQVILKQIDKIYKAKEDNMVQYLK
ncbi:UNVERIFIED_CONTAM: hypothetical protein Sradi_3597700 [Sesamum radiatum]|uniref:RNase H type-1 domain-containing protein n=1 Tax=Sesamum radiatum TaxID=300843 RepID=A0AAW2QHD0_SESRA